MRSLQNLPAAPFIRARRNRALFCGSGSSQAFSRLGRGFTLLEILVVLAILGLLVGLAITNVDKILGNAQVDTTRMFVNQTLSLPLTSYRIKVGDFPSTSEGLQALITPPSGKADRWTGPYTDKIPLDPWGEPYQYEYPGKRHKGSYDLWSKGPDKQNETEDDIGNWETPKADK